MDFEKTISSVYQELFRQATLNRNYIYRPTENDKVTISKFIKWLNEKYFKSQIDIGLLMQYFEFQFSHYYGMQSSKFGRNRLMMNWIVGNKAIQRWEERDLSKKWTVKVKVNSEFSLNLRNAFKEENKQRKVSKKSSFVIEINKTEEIYKKRFYNTLKGFVYCQMFTTLYNPKSFLCLGCSNKEICEKTLEIELPDFYELRKI